jgi:hypothetical protein
MKPTSVITVDSTKVDAGVLTALERILYGDAGVDPSLPRPGTVITMFAGGVTEVTPIQPAFDAATDTLTIPTVAGVAYYRNGDLSESGAIVITEDTIVTARPDDGYVFPAGVDDDWFYDYTP